MGSIYLNPPPSSSSPIPNFLELKGDQYNNHSLNHDQVLYAQTYDDDQLVAYQLLDKNPNYCSDESSLTIEFSSHAQDLKVESASNDLGQVLPSSSSSSSWAQHNGNYGHNPMSSSHRELEDKIGTGIINKNDDHRNSKKWKPSKVRIMQKMMATSNHTHKGEDQHNLEQGRRKLYNNDNCSRNNNNKNNNNGVIRVCSDCRTTTTPLWRSGPQGPKSLCNACGIRQRKARRAAMAAAATATATEFVAEEHKIAAPIARIKSPKPSKIHEEMRERGEDYSHGSHPLPLKKRGKTIEVEKCGFSSSNNKDYVTPNYYYSKRRALPRDEEEGAILLMALSCGLACTS